jgi:hypothetical protein
MGIPDQFPITDEEFARAEEGDVTVIPRFVTRTRMLARVALRLVMADLTRRYLNCAPNEETSHALWDAVQTKPENMTDAEANELDGLAYEAGGWWLFADIGIDDPATFIPTVPWKARYAKWVRGQRT